MGITDLFCGQPVKRIRTYRPLYNKVKFLLCLLGVASSFQIVFSLGKWVYSYMNEHSWHELGHVKDPIVSDTCEWQGLIYQGNGKPFSISSPDVDNQQIFSSKTVYVESNHHSSPLTDDCSWG